MTVHRFAAFILLFAGCQASTGGRVNSAGDADANADVRVAGEDEPTGEQDQTSAVQAAPLPLPEAQAGGAPALLGARHDLFLAEGAVAQRCRCLAVAAGTPRDRNFFWGASIPTLQPSGQMVVAFSTRGQVCEDEPPNSQGASYRGYERRGADVVVMVEASAPGRPLVSGAILPRPEAGGRLLIQSVPAQLPYGKPLNGEGEFCVVPTDPGATPATIAESELEEPPDVEPFESPESEPDDPAEDGDGAQERRTSLYLGAVLGPSYAQLSADDPALDAQASGFGFNFDLLIGGSPVRDLAVGVVLGGQVIPGPDLESGGQTLDTDGINLNVARFGAFGDYYLIADANLHLLLELGYSSASFSGGGVVPALESMDGFSVGAGLGYDFWIAQRWSLGFLGRFNYAWLDAEGSSVTALLPTLGFTATFH